MEFSQSSINITHRWVEKVVTTNPPKYIPHQEFHWKCNLNSINPFYVVLLIQDNECLQYHKFSSNEKSCDVEIRLSFHPFNWNQSDRVQVSLYQQAGGSGGGVRFSVENQQLKIDPKSLTDILISQENSIKAGKVIDIAKINLSNLIKAKMVLVDYKDVRLSHGRWIVKEEVLKSVSFNEPYLTSGQFTGIINLNK